MYFNNVHILVYVAIGIAGFFIGKFVNWCNYRLSEYKKVFSKDIFRAKELEGYRPNLLLSLITMLIYIVLLYVLGIQKTFLGNLNLIKGLILTPMLLSAFIIDYKLQIIPNRLNLTMFEIGIILMFLAGIFNANIAIDMFLGMLTGAGIFLLITLIGGLIAGKEAMGFGDVKLMGALGIYFGLSNIIIILLIKPKNIKRKKRPISYPMWGIASKVYYHEFLVPPRHFVPQCYGESRNRAPASRHTLLAHS